MGIYNGPSIYNQGGGGGGGYKDGGALVDADFIKVENNAVSSYDNVSRDPVNFYFEVNEGEILNSVVEVTTAVNATINVYVLKNGLYYLLGNVGGNTVNAGDDYKVNITGDSYDIEQVNNINQNVFAEIAGELYAVKQINDILWTVTDYSKIIGTKFIDDSDKYFTGAATRTATGTCLYNMAAINIISGSLSEGWSIASLDDFKNLFQFVGGTGINYLVGVGNQIKKVGSWPNDPGVNNSSGFSSIPTGRYDDGDRDALTSAFYWTSTKASSSTNNVIYVQDGSNNSYIGPGDEYYDYFAVRFCKHV